MKISTDNGGLYGLQPSVTGSAQRIEGRGGLPGPYGGHAEALLDRVEVSEIGGRMARLLEASEAQWAGEIASLSRLYAAGSLEVDPHALGRAMVADALENGRAGGE